MKKKNQGGYSLVELIVAIAIMVIVGVAVTSFLITEINNYRNARAETSVQYEAQLTNNQIHDMLIDVTAGLSYKTTGDAGSRESKLYFYDWDDSTGVQKNIVSIVTWKEADQQLNYVSYEYNGTDITGVEETNNQLMAEYVTDFEVTLPDENSNSRQVSYSLSFAKDGKTYSTQNTVTLRNDVKINNAEINEIFTDITELTSVVKSVTVSPASPGAVIQGGAITFTATVNGENWPSQKVVWSLSSDSGLIDPYDEATNPKGTRINENTGELTIGEKETSQKIGVIAMSVKSLKDNNNDEDKAIKSDPVNVATRYMSSVSLSGGVSQGKEQTVKLEFKGKQFPEQATFTPEINYTCVGEDGTVYTDFTVTPGTLTIGTQGEDYYYGDMLISCGDQIPYDKNVTFAANVTYGKFSGSSSITFNTGSKLSPITAVRFCDGFGNPINSTNVMLDRGATQNLKVQVQRDGSDDWLDADSSMDITWDYQYATRGWGSYYGYTNYASWSSAASGSTGFVEALKAPDELPYSSSDGRVLVKVTAKNASSNDDVTAGELEVDMAKVQLGKPECVYSNIVAAYGYAVIKANVTGIVLEENDISWDYDNYYHYSSSAIFSGLSLSNSTFYVNALIYDEEYFAYLYYTINGYSSSNVQLTIKSANIFNNSNSVGYYAPTSNSSIKDGQTYIFADGLTATYSKSSNKYYLTIHYPTKDVTYIRSGNQWKYPIN